MPTRNSQRLRGLILDNVSLFSEKQRRFLRSDEWAPNKLFEDEDAKAEVEEEDRKPSPSLKREKLRDRGEVRAEKGAESKINSEGKSMEGKADGKAVDSKTDAKRSEEKTGDAEKDAGGGWTFTIRERPMPDHSTSGKKRRKGAEDSEARFEAMAEKNEASQKKQEEDVDSSLALLERLQQTHTTHTPHERSKRDLRSPKKRSDQRRHRHLSRSKSISAASVTSSDDRKRRKKRKGSRSRGARGAGSGVSFEEALRRRMQQRDSEMETSRMPVVDPGHAKKNWR